MSQTAQAAANDPFPANPALRACYTAGLAALEQADFPTAVASFQQAAALAPGDVGVLRLLGEALLAAGDLAEAVAALGEAVRQAPDDADLLVDLAHAQLLSGAGDAARATIERAAALHPDDADTRLALARIYEAIGETTLAAGAYEQVHGDTASPGALTELARLHLQLGQYSEAEAAFRQLGAIDPEHDLFAQQGRVWCRIKRQDWRGALELALAAARADRYDLTTALLAYSKARLFGELTEQEGTVREAALAERITALLHDHLEWHANADRATANISGGWEA